MRGMKNMKECGKENVHDMNINQQDAQNSRD